MNRPTKVVWAITTCVVLITATVLAEEYEPPHSQPGPAADKVFFRSFHVDRAPLELTSGNMDLYYFGLRTDAALDLQDDPTTQLYEAPSTTLSLILNPAPAPDGRLNPFSLPEVRRAMQFLVERNLMYAPVSSGGAHNHNDQNYVTSWWLMYVSTSSSGWVDIVQMYITY